jgi:predicted kinase
VPKLIITCGVSGSGKSTYAREINQKDFFFEINRDQWRFDLFCNGEKDWSKYKFTQKREDLVTKKCEEEWSSCVAHKLDVIVSNTNLTPSTLNGWIEKGKAAGYEVEVKYFPITLEEAFKRNEKRGALAVPREVLIQQWKKWLEITNFRRYTPYEYGDTPKAVVCDIDGTVAKMSGRSPYEWNRVGEDTPRREIIHLVESIVTSADCHLIFVSGRDGVCFNETYSWLEEYIYMPFELIMRAKDDQRPDTVVKEEIFWNKIAPHYDVLYWFDDRPAVVRRMKDIGLNVIDVSSGYEEF